MLRTASAVQPSWTACLPSPSWQPSRTTTESRAWPATRAASTRCCRVRARSRLLVLQGLFWELRSAGMHEVAHVATIAAAGWGWAVPEFLTAAGRQDPFSHSLSPHCWAAPLHCNSADGKMHLATHCHHVLLYICGCRLRGRRCAAVGCAGQALPAAPGGAHRAGQGYQRDAGWRGVRHMLH